jgi:hypothetical protein
LPCWIIFFGAQVYRHNLSHQYLKL